MSSFKVVILYGNLQILFREISLSEQNYIVRNQTLSEMDHKKNLI
jgi:hypothetical protein